MSKPCLRCEGVLWVCENHPEKPWDKTKDNGCDCGAGDPCPDCNSGIVPENIPGMKVLAEREKDS